jgi:hypothetical protein
MSLQAQQNFLARIFTDESLRHSFWENPAKIGAENGLSQTDIDQLKEIVAADLNFFADSLFHKRLHEAEKLLPLTKKALNQDFFKLFREFSQKFQPDNIKKHLEDAVEFSKFLQKQSVNPISAYDTAKFEQTKHEFFSLEKRIAFCILRHDVFSLQKKLGFAVWLRIGKKIHHFIW